MVRFKLEISRIGRQKLRGQLREELMRGRDVSA